MAGLLRRERHSVTDLKIHLVCVTKYRRSVFTGESIDLIQKTFREVAEKMNFKRQKTLKTTLHGALCFANRP